jgi:internalin A
LTKVFVNRPERKRAAQRSFPCRERFIKVLHSQSVERYTDSIERTTTPRSPEADMAEQAKPVSARPRRFLRFSVRGLIVLVLLIGGCLGWMARNARIQRDAVAAIKRAGGSVRYSHVRRKSTSKQGQKPWVPVWLADLIGVDYLDHVTNVRLSESTMGTDSAIEQTGHLSQLRQLILDDSSVGDAGLAHMRGLRSLSILDLSHTKVTDLGLAHLEGLLNLRALDLSHTQITGEGLAHLKGLENLSSLDLTGTRLRDDGLAHLERLVSLKFLVLDGTEVTDAGLAHLKGLTRLSALGLDETRVTDAGLAHLEGLSNLTRLSIQYTQISDEGVPHLKALAKLSIVLVGSTQISDDGEAELSRALPAIRVFH